MGQCKSSEAASEKSSPAEELSRPRRNSGLLMIESKESDTVASSTKSLRRFGYKNDGDRRHMEEKESFPNLNARVSIKSTLLKSGIFNDEVNKRGISPADIDNIVDAFKIEHFREGQFILEKDDFRCEKLFIVRQGVFKCLDGAKCKMVMKEKSILGELGFFHHNPPLLSICTSSVISSAYVLNKRDFKAIVEKGRNLQDIRILQSLSEAQKYRMKDKIQLTNFVRGIVRTICTPLIPSALHTTS